MSLFRRKPLESPGGSGSDSGLKRTLSWPHLTALGVGAIIGTGIYTLTGVGAARAGPAVILAFALCGVVCAFAALAYAELATMMPAAGSAYTFSYVALGEIFAWIVGWSLVLEYGVTCSVVAVGWSGHMVEFLRAHNWSPPDVLLAGPMKGGIVNLPAVLVVVAITAMLTLGAKESATVNFVLVVIKIVALTAFVIVAFPGIKAANYHPFSPYGFFTNEASGQPRGVMAAVSIVFFAFFGFDAVSTAAEETKNPKRDLTIGIIGSMILCTLIYMVVAGVAVGASSYLVFSKSDAPLVSIIRGLNQPLMADLIGGAAIVALPTVILVMMYGQSRIFFAMSRDGLFPKSLAKVHPKLGTPVLMTLLTGVFVAVLAGLVPLDKLAELSNSGTMLAFIAAAASMMVLRVTKPDAPRLFRAPLWFIVGPFVLIACLYFMWELPAATKLWFFEWQGAGLVVYALLKIFGGKGAKAA